MRTFGKIVVIGAGVLALAACGEKENTAGSVQSSGAAPASASTSAPASKAPTGKECTAEDVKTTGKFGEAPTITIPDDCDPPKKLITKDLEPGTGEGAKAGANLKMNYSLVTWSNKQKLDSSFDRGEPFDLTLGAGMVIKGWDQGLEGIKQGARRLLIIPPDLGYGEGGRGIAPNETLVFVTDAVSVPTDKG
ncbi:FKBP-type peptidyl-prolyl cis-trans isomerase [Amycolatopsis thailandensis]|uniref:Peptidyl-prolyl cis-trans isomerase n=1 Tax=Amycolatopsis thailandensis TaxID=589330 RepID=A0A229SBH8_9PSEU|nr:FKBP-type peptidyl-prolyl cis-trans isomerase [Amycolatopsis thailandensis]OXM56303.1 peptidylprolyl isomerase [Amycolatopsis thailandensis]